MHSLYQPLKTRSSCALPFSRQRTSESSKPECAWHEVFLPKVDLKILASEKRPVPVDILGDILDGNLVENDLKCP